MDLLKRRGTRSTLLAVLVGVMLLGLMPGGVQRASAEAPTVRLALVGGWPGLTVKNEVVKTILEGIGYETEEQEVSLPIALNAVGSGELDVFLGLWIPSSNSYIEPYYKDGTITRLASHLDSGALYRSAVPAYVWEAGVHSLADLTKYEDKFDRKYYGIEPGNDGNELMLKAIDNDTYSYGDWQLVECSIAGMLSAVRHAVEQKEWIIFSAWKPHWMNIVYDIRYLDDPEGIWGGESQVDTVVHTPFVHEEPNVTRFLRQFHIESRMQSQWIYDYSYKERPRDEVAQEWVVGNLDTIAVWLDGVKAVDGRPAIEALREAVQAD